MQTILHNILTDLELPYFLLMYTGIGLVGLTAGAVAIWLCDGTRDVDLPDDDDAIDPYQIAFLKGGANLERWSPKGFRLFGAPKMVRRITTEFDVSTLSEIQRVAWDWCSRARLLSEVHHRNVGLSKMIANRCDALQAALTTQHYLETSRRQLACKLTKGTLSTALVTLGLYKLVTMAIIGRGESVGLIMLMAIGLLGTAIICRRVRLSDLGHRYLIHLELRDQDVAADALACDRPTDRLLRMALYGTSEPHHVTSRLDKCIEEPELSHR
jgi:uncharacterized protein (TIGR04222 family)